MNDRATNVEVRLRFFQVVDNLLNPSVPSLPLDPSPTVTEQSRTVNLSRSPPSYRPDSWGFLENEPIEQRSSRESNTTGAIVLTSGLIGGVHRGSSRTGAKRSGVSDADSPCPERDRTQLLLFGASVVVLLPVVQALAGLVELGGVIVVGCTTVASVLLMYGLLEWGSWVEESADQDADESRPKSRRNERLSEPCEWNPSADPHAEERSSV